MHLIPRPRSFEPEQRLKLEVFGNLRLSYIGQQGRYCYINQRSIVEWNLTRLAECLIPLVDSDKNKATDLLNDQLSTIPELFKVEWRSRMMPKFGLESNPSNSEGDDRMIKMWFDYLEKEKLDFTLSFRKLSELFNDNNDQKNDFHAEKEVVVVADRVAVNKQHARQHHPGKSPAGPRK